MKKTPATPAPRTPHAVLAIDPGITTGWALIDPVRDEILGTSVWGTAELKETLDLLIRKCFTAGMSLEAVIEKMPSVGKTGPLAMKLEAIRREIYGLVQDVYDIPVTVVAPSEWKPSRVARTGKAKLPKKFNGSPLMPHQRDAILMGRYVIDRRANAH